MRKLNATRCDCGHCYTQATDDHTYWAVHTSNMTVQPLFEDINDRRSKWRK